MKIKSLYLFVFFASFLFGISQKAKANNLIIFKKSIQFSFLKDTKAPVDSKFRDLITNDDDDDDTASSKSKRKLNKAFSLLNLRLLFLFNAAVNVKQNHFVNERFTSIQNFQKQILYKNSINISICCLRI